MRIAITGIALALLLAGCTGTAPGGTVSPVESDSPTDESIDRTTTGAPTDGGTSGRTTERTGTTTPPATPCEEYRVQTVDPAREDVTPSSLPDRPANLTAASVEKYVEAYERAFRRNLGLEKNTKQYEVTITASEVSKNGDRFVVSLEANFWYNAGGPKPGNETATIIHADGPYYDVEYTVTDGWMRRNGSEYSGLVGSVVVECWG